MPAKIRANTINKDDVETIAGHFSAIKRLALTNNLNLGSTDLYVGVIYGETSELSSHYKRITNEYHFPVHIGLDFWHRLTGDSEFYKDLILAITSVAIESDFASELENVVKRLAATETIRNISSSSN